jgi:hypothetical protein
MPKSCHSLEYIASTRTGRAAPNFAVILRQASFFAPVEYQKSTLPSQKTRLPRLTANLGTAYTLAEDDKRN